MKLLESWNVLKEIETEKAIYGTLRGEIMTGHRHGSDVATQTFKQWDGNDWEILQAAGCDDGYSFSRLGRVASYVESNLRRYGSRHGTGIDHHSNDFGCLRALAQHMGY